MDMTASIIPKSDQLNADDLMTGPITVTIDKVSAGSAEQPVDVFLVEFPGRAFRPSKSMRRVMVAAWGANTAAYTGQRMTLYREPTIKFGRDEVGGIRISHLSGIDKPLKIALTVSRGKREPFIVAPLQGKGADREKSFAANSADRASESVDTSADTTPPTRTELHAQNADFGTGVGQPITEKQIGMMGSLLKKVRMDDREIAIAFVSNVIGRPIESSTDLTAHEASNVITALLKEEEQMKLRDEAKGAE